MSETRGRPFPPGNRFGRGRPKGSRNKRSAQAQEILDQYSESLIKKCIAQGLAGDTRALGLCMERILPALREPGVRLKLPKLNHLNDVNLAKQRVLQSHCQREYYPGRRRDDRQRPRKLWQDHRRPRNGRKDHATGEAVARTKAA